MKRRQLLEVFAGLPPALAGYAGLPVEKANAATLTPQEVYRIYVENALRALPLSMTMNQQSAARAIIEANGAGLAAVFARLLQE